METVVYVAYTINFCLSRSIGELASVELPIPRANICKLGSNL